jgi:DNA-binding transcriptional LysR family regulator
MGIPSTSLEHWAVLAAVVDQGGFAPAAAALHRSQSAVSYAVARLQSALDVPLLVIEGRKGVLTAEGQTLLKRVRPLLRDLETLERLARSLKQGWESELRLVVDAAFPRERLLKIVAELRQLCPNTQIELSDAVLSGAEQAIVEGSADVVVTSHVPAEFLGEFLMDVTFVAVARPDHALFGLERVLSVDDLARHVQIVVRDSGTKAPRDEGWLGAERALHGQQPGSLAGHDRSRLGLRLDSRAPDRRLAAQGALRPLPLAAGGTRKCRCTWCWCAPSLRSRRARGGRMLRAPSAGHDGSAEHGRGVCAAVSERARAAAQFCCAPIPAGSALQRCAGTVRACLAHSARCSACAPAIVWPCRSRRAPRPCCCIWRRLRVGAVYLPLNSGYTAAELEYFLTDGPSRRCSCARRKDLVCCSRWRSASVCRRAYAGRRWRMAR